MAALHPCLVVAACALAWSGGVSAYYDQLPPSLQQLPSSLQQLPSSLQQLPSSLQQLPSSLQQLPGVPAPDPETASYLIPRLAHKYRPPTGDWLDAADPRLYLLTENDNDEPQVQSEVESGPRRLKRTGLGGTPSLSIVNPLEVLRQRLLLEIARRRMRQSEEKIHANREWLLSIGKRSVDAQQQDSVHDKVAEADEDRSGHDAVSRWASAS